MNSSATKLINSLKRGDLQSCGLLISIYTSFVILERLVLRSSSLNEADYHSPIIFLQWGSHIYAWIIIGLTIALATAARIHSIPLNWSAFTEFKGIRVIISLMTCLLAWKFSTYDINLYFNQSHYADRFLLIIFAGLVCWKPIFTFPFLLSLFPIITQFNFPIGGYSIAESSLLYKLLLLFGASLSVQLITKRKTDSLYIFAALCMLASFYWANGFSKLKIDWFSLAQPHLLLFSSYSNGWLGFLEPDTISAIGRNLQSFVGILKVFTLIVECSFLFFLWKRSTLIFCLMACILFHLGVFAVSGIFFGMWITIEITVLSLIFTPQGKQFTAKLPKRYFIASIVLILIGSRLFHPVVLTWYDSPLNYTYHFKAIGESGTQYNLDNAAIAPYDYQFTLGGFSYLSKEKQLPVTWGATGNREFAEHMSHATDQSIIDQAYRIYAQSEFIPIRSQRLDQLLRNIIINYNERGTKNAFPYILNFPPHLWRSSGPNPFRNQEIVQRIDVVRSSVFFDETNYKEIDRRVIYSIDLTSKANRNPQ